MPVSFADVKVGDRVRLTSTNGDEATFTVTGLGMNSRSIYGHAGLNVHDSQWDTLEILTKPLPTEPGLYVSADANLSVATTVFYQLSRSMMWDTDRSGEWLSVPSESDLPRDLVRLVKETDR